MMAALENFTPLIGGIPIMLLKDRLWAGSG